MPTYTYRCTRCQEEFEEEMDKEAKKSPPCPECGSSKTRKIIQSHPVHFKGSGFTKSVDGDK